MSNLVSEVETLSALTVERLQVVSRALGIPLPASLNKSEKIRRLIDSARFDLGVALREFTREELRDACRANGLDDSGRARIDLAERILQARPPEEDFQTLGNEPTDAVLSDLGLPTPGAIVLCRQRQYLVEEVLRGEATPGNTRVMTRVRMICLDDDAPGRVLEVLWELELGAKILSTRSQGLGTVHRIDEPRHFAAYLNALKWNCVTATDAQLFQSPFRAGIKLMAHQLTPLQKALKLPRANLFIADDVGLGKTIEAGLVLQELILRQRVNFTLIVAPASVVLQWRDEMNKRFGLQFEVYNREFIARRRRERGFRVNPWATHARFIISHQMLRRPEHRDPLLQHLGERSKKSLLILDEAHAAAPASATKYAVDSQFTNVIRDVAPRFENRLFLSATPHNGHSNSFAALLELLDPQRFTRGVPVESDDVLKPIMVRRLKSDLRALGLDYPARRLVTLELTRTSDAWTCKMLGSEAYESGQTDAAQIATIQANAPDELELARMLAEYTSLVQTNTSRSKFVLVNLQKRLLSSVPAFYRTLKVHARGAIDIKTNNAAQQSTLLDPELYGESDDEVDEREEREAAAASQELSLNAQATALRDQMLRNAERLRNAPDAKINALLHWIREHQCKGAGFRAEGKSGKLSAEEISWSNTRLLIFTEYGDTRKYIEQQLRAALDHTHLGDERVLSFHGGITSDEQREAIQAAFNDPNHPVRILVATDAAREGVNLQGACSDLLHYDLPWNPSKLEQRNGRIDRTLQPSKEVRCMYFSYPQRPEDRILEVIVQKIDVIQRELGSLGTVVMEQIEAALENGIDQSTLHKITKADLEDTTRNSTRKHELEHVRDLKNVKGEIDSASWVLNKSQKEYNFDPELLRNALDAACELTLGDDAQPSTNAYLKPSERWEGGYEVPPLPDSWERTLDFLRPLKERDETWWEWRKRPLLPVTFTAPERISAPVVHLHLEHPFVQRMLARFRSQGFAAHDLSRVTVLKSSHTTFPYVAAFGRLSLFGKGATRLHDEIITITAPWLESGGPEHLQPLGAQEEAKVLAALDVLLKQPAPLSALPESLVERLRKSADDDFTALWPTLDAEAEARTQAAKVKLDARAQEDAIALEKILKSQRAAIQKQISQAVLPFADTKEEKEQRRQFENDAKHMQARYAQIEREITQEPQQLRELFEVELRRFEPVGLVYLWPETRT